MDGCTHGQMNDSVNESTDEWMNERMLQGPQPMILYCQHGGTSVRLVYTVMPAPIAGKKSTEKQGGQLKGDNKKPIVAMAPHPSGSTLCTHCRCAPG